MVLSLAGPRYVWSLSQVELPQEETLELQMFWITMTHSKLWSYQTILVCCTAFNRFALNESDQDYVVLDVVYFISCLHEISRKNLNFLWRQSVMDSVECWWGQGCGASFPNWWVQFTHLLMVQLARWTKQGCGENAALGNCVGTSTSPWVWFCMGTVSQ